MQRVGLVQLMLGVSKLRVADRVRKSRSETGGKFIVTRDRRPVGARGFVQGDETDKDDGFRHMEDDHKSLVKRRKTVKRFNARRPIGEF